MDRYSAEQITDGTNMLGEGPLWIGPENTLVWTDILGSAVYLHVPSDGSVRKIALPSFIACMGETSDGRIIAAGGTGWVLYDMSFQHPEGVAPAPFDVSSIRFNDGKPGPDGAFWVGSMDWDARRDAGRLYRLASDSISRAAVGDIDGPFTIPNGLGWSPDGTVMYYTDSAEGTIYRYGFDPSDGSLSGRDIFVRDDDLPGVPDGLTVDSDGCIWSARWGGGLIAAYDPGGRRIIEVDVPAVQPSSCCFGGVDMNELYITSAKVGLKNPGDADGALFRCRCGSKGLSNCRYLMEGRQEGNA